MISDLTKEEQMANQTILSYQSYAPLKYLFQRLATVKRVHLVWAFTVLLLVPVIANAQTPERITLLDNFGDFDKGEELFIYGSLAQIVPDSYLIVQIINPDGDLCQIQQLSPLSNGMFLTESIPLKGRICGLSGDYGVKIFYGDYTASAKFSVSTLPATEISDSQTLDDAVVLISEKILSVQEKTNANTLIYSDRLTAITSVASENTISSLEELYVDLWTDFFIEDELYEITPTFRPAIETSLDSTAQLVESGKLSFDDARNIDRQTFAAIFYYEIGDKRTAIQLLNDSFYSTKNVDPVKTSTKKAPTFAELEETLLNLMGKSSSVMSKTVKEEIAFVFSRGTGPLYSNELGDMLDLLTKSRYLDVVTRKNNDLYKIVEMQWESTKSSLKEKDSIEELLDRKPNVDELHLAALLLRDLDNVDRFISSDSEDDSELATLIRPEWDRLESKLVLAESVQNILDSETQIKNMKNVIDVSSRITKAVDISRQSNLDSRISDNWETLLVDVGEAQSMDEILQIVHAFDSSINELREKRNPLTLLKFEYESMKSKAELQSDHKNLFVINNALKIIDTAENMEKNTPAVSKIDRIEVLLTWASEKAPIIKTELDSYTKDAHKVRASDILQRAKSIENLVELSMTKNRFLPGYVDFTDSMKQRIDDARNLVIANDLDSADSMVRSLFSEWRQISKAYEDDPYGSDVGYSVDELKRIEYREKLDVMSGLVNAFYNSDFEAHAAEYDELTADAHDLIDYGNFIDANSKLKEIGNYLSDKLAEDNERIIFEITFDQERDIWILSGFVEKSVFDRREDLYVTIYNMDGSTHSSLEFTDTRQGEFFTQWHAPTEPGLYVVMLQYQNVKASQIINIEEKIVQNYSNQDLDIVELAREFEELKTFMEEFGGPNYDEENHRFAGILNEIKVGFADRDSEKISEKLSDLQRMIERYLPVRSRSAVIEVQYEDDKLYLSGAVQKTLSFREDLFVDIYDQRGNHVEEVALKDTSSGHFNEIISLPFERGTYVAKLEYHDLTVTDFFNIYS